MNESKIDSVSISAPGTFYFGNVSVGDIVIYNDGKSYKYNPKEDITAYEVSCLLIMFHCGVVGRYQAIDYYGYVTEYKLERHFDEI